MLDDAASLKVFLLLLWWATLPQPLTPPVFDPPPTLLLLPEAQDSPWPSALAQTREVREPVADKGGRRAAAVVPRRKEAGSGGGSRGGASHGAEEVRTRWRDESTGQPPRGGDGVRGVTLLLPPATCPPRQPPPSPCRPHPPPPLLREDPLPCSRTTATSSQSGTMETWKRGGDERRDKAGGVGERRGGGCERGEEAAAVGIGERG